MSVEIKLLKALSKGEAYQRFNTYLNPDGITEDTKWILDKYRQMFVAGYKEILPAELFAYTYNKLRIKVSKEAGTRYKKIMDNVAKVKDAEAVDAMKGFIQADYALKINDITNRIIDGEDGHSLETVMSELDAFKKEVQFKQQDKLKLVSMDVKELKKVNAPKDGLKWGLQCLNEVAGCLRQGDFVEIFSRPDSGKTSFCIDQTAAFLKQIPKDKQIIWFNNEEMGGRIALRYYANIHNVPATDVGDRVPYLGKQVAIYDAPAIHKRDVEEYLERHNPACIIFNTMDKIKGFDTKDSDTRRLRDLYQWGRELSKRFAPVLALCQCSADGEGAKVLTMDMLADSKTDKAGEADLIIGIGRGGTDDSVRYINTPKNKLTGTDNKKPHIFGRGVSFDHLTGRFRDFNETGLPG